MLNVCVGVYVCMCVCVCVLQALSQALDAKKADPWIAILTTRNPDHLNKGSVLVSVFVSVFVCGRVNSNVFKYTLQCAKVHN